jgi:hypothetical protein
VSSLIRGLGAYEREQLIKRYIALLDEIEQYHLDDGDRDAELGILTEASNLMGATLGNIGGVPFEQPDDAPRAVMFALMSWRSAYAQKADGHMWDEVISELMRLESGDLPEMLKPANRKQNQHPLGGKVMYMKLAAIGWQEFIRKNHPNKYNNYPQEISDKYGIEFDTLKSWESKTKQYFGNEFFSKWLEYAKSGMIAAYTSEEYSILLERDGREFMSLNRKLKPRKVRATERSKFEEYDE